MSKMRNLYPIQTIEAIREKFLPKLNEFFKVNEGETGTRREDSMSNDARTDLGNSLYQILNYDLNLTRNVAIDLYNKILAILGNRFVDGRKKTSRVIVEILTEGGVDANNARIQVWLSSWAAKFQTDSIKYEIGLGVNDFDLLGQMTPDGNGRSCYYPHGQWKDAPVTLAAGLFHEIPTFVIRLLKDGEVKARCWGLLEETEPLKLYLSNAYYASGINHNMAMFVRAVEHSSGVPLMYKTSDRPFEWPVYVNSDTVLVRSLTDKTTDKKPRSYLVDGCVICGDQTNTNNGFRKAFCDYCVQGIERIRCSVCDRRFRAEEARSCTDCGVVNQCADCFRNTTHRGCSCCGNMVCGAMHQVLRFGYPRTWCNVCVNDRATTCTDCGTIYFGLYDCPSAHCNQVLDLIEA